ncbi:sensor domain-containing protein [Kribbella sp. HUAS MG21]|uniref:Sensor domain-containing protein n=1 Tax=Kribbella sp. HUAS MG21 TaxID=3160966 RepID=A0AAU7T8A9_9ACTN
MTKSLRAVACSAVLMLAFTACSGGTDSGSPTASSTPSSTPAPTSTTPATAPSSTPSSTPPAASPSAVPSAVPKRTAAQLAKALLVLADLPPGFSIEKDAAGDDADVTVSSKDSRCAKLVAFTNADNPPGSKASAGQSYSGGAQGPFIDETIDAMGSPAAAQALQKSFRQAVTACRTMSLKVPGEGTSPISVREVSAPDVGTDPVAVRFTATAGPAQGFEVTMVTAAVDDVVVAVTVVNGLPEDIEGASTAAVEKVEDTLAASTSGT